MGIGESGLLELSSWIAIRREVTVLPSSGVGGGGAGCKRTPKSFYLLKIPESLDKIPENLGKISENLGKIREKWRPTLNSKNGA